MKNHLFLFFLGLLVLNPSFANDSTFENGKYKLTSWLCEGGTKKHVVIPPNGLFMVQSELGLQMEEPTTHHLYCPYTACLVDIRDLKEESLNNGNIEFRLIGSYRLTSDKNGAVIAQSPYEEGNDALLLSFSSSQILSDGRVLLKRAAKAKYCDGETEALIFFKL